MSKWMAETLTELLSRSQSNALESRVTTLEVVARERMRLSEAKKEEIDEKFTEMAKRLDIHEKILWAIGIAAQAVLQDKYRGIAEAIKVTLAFKSGS